MTTEAFDSFRRALLVYVLSRAIKAGEKRLSNDCMQDFSPALERRRR